MHCLWLILVQFWSMKGATECNNVSWVVKFQIFSTKVGLFLDKEFQNAFDFIMDISFNLMGEFFDKKTHKILPQFKVLHTYYSQTLYIYWLSKKPAKNWNQSMTISNEFQNLLNLSHNFPYSFKSRTSDSTKLNFFINLVFYHPRRQITFSKCFFVQIWSEVRFSEILGLKTS